MKIKMFFLSILFVSSGLISLEHPIIIDHDGGVDDVIATTLQILHSPKLVKAITIVPADCYALPAVWVMQQLRKHFSASNLDIPIGVSSNEGVNFFPDFWREDAWKLSRLSVWPNDLSLDDFSLNNIASASDVLVHSLKESLIPVNILETGPCTNIAEILHKHPGLKHKINRIFIMGGAFFVKGNVEEFGHDGTAEWNIYNNPQAFYELLQSGVSITLIPLDATQYTPIRKEFISKLAQNCNKKPIQLVCESLKIIQPLIDNGQYLFWDTLTSAAMINGKIIKTKKLKINVIIDGISMGRTVVDENGFEVDVALWADQELFEKTVMDILLG